MKPFVRKLMFTGVLAMAASSTALSQTSSSFEQRYRSKYGRPSPQEEARIQLTAPLEYAAPGTLRGETQYTARQIRQMERTAMTSEQYGQIADYYAARQRLYRHKAAEEMHLWAERNAVISPLMEKWPRPVDSARNLFEYYRYTAAKSGELMARYSKLADEGALR